MLFCAVLSCLYSIAWQQASTDTVANRQRTVWLICPTQQAWDGVKHPNTVTGLQVLFLDKAEGDDSQLKSLGKFRNVRALHIHSDRMTDQVLKDIVKLKHLEAIVISSGKMTDRGIRALRKCKKLKVIGLYYTNITKKGIDQMRKQMPDVYIENYDGESGRVFRGSGCIRIPFSRKYFGSSALK